MSTLVWCAACAINPAEVEVIENVFCPTGQGGGVDPSCKKGGTSTVPSGSITGIKSGYINTTSVDSKSVNTGDRVISGLDSGSPEILIVRLSKSSIKLENSMGSLSSTTRKKFDKLNLSKIDTIGSDQGVLGEYEAPYIQPRVAIANKNKLDNVSGGLSTPYQQSAIELMSLTATSGGITIKQYESDNKTVSVEFSPHEKSIGKMAEVNGWEVTEVVSGSISRVSIPDSPTTKELDWRPNEMTPEDYYMNTKH